MYAHVRSCYTPPAYAAARAVIKPDSLTVPRCPEPSGLAALLLVRLAARSRTVLDSWHLALFTRAADLSSQCAINFHMLPRSRPLAEGVAAAPPGEPLSALACQRKHARISDDQWRPRATAIISGARAVCALLNGAMFNNSSREVEANSLTTFRHKKRGQFLARKFAFQLRIACAQAGAAACALQRQCAAMAMHRNADAPQCDRFVGP